MSENMVSRGASLEFLTGGAHGFGHKMSENDTFLDHFSDHFL